MTICHRVLWAQSTWAVFMFPTKWRRARVVPLYYYLGFRFTHQVISGSCGRGADTKVLLNVLLPPLRSHESRANWIWEHLLTGPSADVFVSVRAAKKCVCMIHENENERKTRCKADLQMSNSDSWDGDQILGRLKCLSGTKVTSGSMTPNSM